MSLALPRLGADWGAAFFMPQLLPTDGRSVKAGDQNEKPQMSCGGSRIGRADANHRVRH